MNKTLLAPTARRSALIEPAFRQLGWPTNDSEAVATVERVLDVHPDNDMPVDALVALLEQLQRSGTVTVKFPQSMTASEQFKENLVHVGGALLLCLIAGIGAPAVIFLCIKFLIFLDGGGPPSS